MGLDDPPLTPAAAEPTGMGEAGMKGGPLLPPLAVTRCSGKKSAPSDRLRESNGSLLTGVPMPLSGLGKENRGHYPAKFRGVLPVCAPVPVFSVRRLPGDFQPESRTGSQLRALLPSTGPGPPPLYPGSLGLVWYSTLTSLSRQGQTRLSGSL